MPWERRSVVDERLAFARLIESGEPMASTCRQFGISRQTGYKWFARYEEMGEAGLRDQSRAPQSHGRRTADHVVAALVALRRKHPSWGARKLVRRLGESEPRLKPELPAKSTVFDILKREGLVKPRKRRRSVGPITPPKHGASTPNDVWATDFKGEFKMRDGRYCYPLTVQDYASRFCLGCRARDSTRVQTAKEAFADIFREHGLPKGILSDNGVPFASNGFSGLTELSAWWIELGISVFRTTPGNPQENGRLERFHRTLKKETTRPPSANKSAQQRAFNRFRYTFNHERPHESLDDDTPADHYRESKRSLPKRTPIPDYENHLEIRRLNGRGELQLHDFRFAVSAALRKREIALEPIEDDIWRLWFYRHLLGTFNVRTGLLARPGFKMIVNPRSR